jgi:hypothetical protein
MKTVGDPTPETSCISNMLQKSDSAQHNADVMNQALSHTFTESLVT